MANINSIPDDEIFDLANKHFGSEEVMNLIQRWMQEIRYDSFLRFLINPNTTMQEIVEAVHFFHHLVHQGVSLADSILKGSRVDLVRRFFSEQLEFIIIAKEYVDIHDFNKLVKSIIYPSNSHGKLGGKAAGVFLATAVLKRMKEQFPSLGRVRIPKTWYLNSDCLYSFLQQNNLEEISEQKYKPLPQVRQEYSLIKQLMHNAAFPFELIRGLSSALDDFGEAPLVVRSSSLLEDRMGIVFTGKYESCFLANKGSKQDRLQALIEAIVTVFASTFAPEPIAYRLEQGLIDFHEDMAVLIQEVVGREVGSYFLPAFAGIATSHRKDRRNPAICLEEGKIQLVPGLWSRAKRTQEKIQSFSIPLGAEDKALRLTYETMDQTVCQEIDLIDLRSGGYATADIDSFFRDCGEECLKLWSISYELAESGNTILRSRGKSSPSLLCHALQNLVEKTAFIDQIIEMVNVLQGVLKIPLELSFASDGVDLYLLQCRPVEYSK